MLENEQGREGPKAVSAGLCRTASRVLRHDVRICGEPPPEAEVCRNAERGQQAKDEIVQKTSSPLDSVSCTRN